MMASQGMTHQARISFSAVIFTLLICWPAAYRLTLPDQAGDLAYYVVAYALPPIVCLAILWSLRNVIPLMLFVGSLAILLLATIVFATVPNASATGFFHAAKFYLTPIFLVLAGSYFSKKLSRQQFANLMLTIVLGHLVFSLLFYFDILPNVVYLAEGEFSENWTNVVGGYRAFLGLTLSKFDLAYQVGFVLVGILLCPDVMPRKSLRWGIGLVALFLVIFTFNKTLSLVIPVVLLLQAYWKLRRISRAAALISLGSLGLLLVYPIVLFLMGELVINDLFEFLSPQTFWSRVMIWQEVAVFNYGNLIHGLGAGYFTQADITLDNQFLYTYLEMGAVGAILYFGLFGWLILKMANGHRYGISMVGLLVLVFVVGDILNAHTLMYVMGMFLGQLPTPRSADDWFAVVSRRMDVPRVAVAHAKES